jgi:hypothetical protein
MAVKRDASKTAKLAAALRDNLKRRKAQAKARGVPPDNGGPAKGLGTAPQAGLEDQPHGSRLPRQNAGVAPHQGPNAAKKHP